MPNFALSDSEIIRACDTFDTPFHLYDEQGIRSTARRWQRAFAWCEDFREYFAVKALPTPAILRILTRGRLRRGLRKRNRADACRRLRLSRATRSCSPPTSCRRANSGWRAS